MKTVLTYAIFIGITFAVGMVSAFFSPPGPWYDGLKKPWFNPPMWAFPVAWTTLYVLIGIAGARAWIAGLRGLPMLFWMAQLGLNGLWSIMFFGMQWPEGALVEVLFMFAAIVGFIVVTWRGERIASILFFPYALWVGFAAFLNGTIVVLNA